LREIGDSANLTRRFDILHNSELSQCIFISGFEAITTKISNTINYSPVTIFLKFLK